MAKAATRIMIVDDHPAAAVEVHLTHHLDGLTWAIAIGVDGVDPAGQLG